MHAHLQKVLAVALHPDTCDGEATAAFTVARRLAAKNGSADLPVAEAKIISRAGSSAGAGREGPRAGSPQQRTAWRVSIRADRLHEFLGVLIGKAGATGVVLSLTTFALLGRHVHTPSRLEFDLKGPRGAVEALDGWIEFLHGRCGIPGAPKSFAARGHQHARRRPFP